MDAARSRWLWLLLPAVLLAFDLAKLEVRDSITDFVPVGEGAERIALATELAETKLARGMVLCVGRPGDPNAALAVAGSLAEALARHPEVAWAAAGVEADAELGALFELYFPRRMYFASADPGRELPGRLAEPALRAHARELRAELARPVPSAAAGLVERDPLGLFAEVVERVSRLRSGVALEGGRFVAEPAPGDPEGIGRWAVVFAETRSSPFEAARQAPLLEALERHFARLAAEHGGGFVLERSGGHRIAVATERSMRRDVRLISLLSLGGVTALLLLFLRSPRAVLLVLYPVATGVLAAIAFGLLAFGSVHLVTLAFAGALTGVAIDYSIHLLNHHALAPDGTPRATLARLRPSLLLGAVTTVAGFAGFVLASFPGVREMGWLAVTGVLAALAAALVALPALLPERLEPTRAQREIAARLGRGAQHLAGAERRGIRAAGLLAAAVVLLAALGIPRVQWMDDPDSLSAVDPDLVREDERVRGRVSDLDAERFVVALADDRDAAVALNDRVWERLSPLVEAGEIGALHSLHLLLWSSDLQRRNAAALAADTELPARVERAFAAEGFRSAAFGDAVRALARPGAPPLRFADLEGSSLERLAAPMLVDRANGAAAVTYLRDTSHPEALRTALAGLDGVHFLDRAALQRELFAGYRRGGLQLIALGAALVLVLLLARYRSPRSAAAAALPALLAIPATLGAFGLLGIPVNLMGTMSLVLVLGLGVDYGIFAVDSRGDAHRLGATLLSLLLSCLTTLLVFGVLALSAHPALRSIGLTTGVGVLVAFLAAPVSAALADRPA